MSNGRLIWLSTKAQELAEHAPQGELILTEFLELAAQVLQKNRRYGDSALAPVRLFSQADTAEQIRVRLDDKLSRVRTSAGDEDEDVIADLIGYLILLRIALLQQQEG